MINNKIFAGITLLLMIVLYWLKDNAMFESIRYFVNYQVILLIIAIYLIVVKKKNTGWFLVIVSVYLYLNEFFQDQFKIFPIIVLLSAVILIILGIMEKNNKKIADIKSRVLNESKSSESNKDDEIK